MKAFKIEIVVVGTKENTENICKSMNVQFKPKRIFYSKCEWLEK